MKDRKGIWGRLWEQTIWFSIIVFVIAMLSFVLAFWPFRENEVVRPIFITLASTLISIATVRVFYEFFASRSLASTFALLRDSTRVGLKAIYLPGESEPEWLACIQQSSSVTMFGIALTIFEKKTVADSMKRRLDAGNMKATLILCDPRSPAMQLRYRDEPHEGPTAWRGGLGSLADRIKSLYELRNSLKQPSNLTLKLFESYPSMAIFCFDDELYYYAYPYGTRGIHGPVFGLRRMHSPMSTFLKDWLDRIEKNSNELTYEEMRDIEERKEKGEFDMQ